MTADRSGPWSGHRDGEPDGIIPLSPVRREPHDPAWAEREPARRGILVIDKPSGQTSHDVVAAVRRAAGARRVGHAGTLDPLATGVLVVCLGSATRVVEEIQAGPKRYEARLRLGVTTTTYDAQGDVIERRDPSGTGRQDVERALHAFRGAIEQIPPMVSALHHQGRRLYELARQGLEVERAPRPVTVHSLALTDWSPPELALTMEVSAGTYVRSIAHDLGAALGVGAHVVALRRTAVGRFELAEALPLPRVIEAFAEGWWPRLLLPLDTALLDYEALVVTAEHEQDIRHGRAFDGPPPAADPSAPVRAYSATGRFLALLRWDAIDRRWRPERVFPTDS